MTILLDALGAFIQAGKSAKSQRALVVTAFPIEDFAKDLKKFDVPTLILHGDDDPIVRIGASALLSSKLVKGAHSEGHSGRAARHVLNPERPTQ
jgi:non-heme chloroperoxidase